MLGFGGYLVPIKRPQNERVWGGQFGVAAGEKESEKGKQEGWGFRGEEKLKKKKRKRGKRA